MTGPKSPSANLPRGSELAGEWTLDPEIVFLNHGSFGACPNGVQAAQHHYRTRMEAEPVRFFIRELPELMDHVRSKLAAFLGADPAGLALVSNATTGVNTALGAVPLAPNDEILITDHGYGACRNAVEGVARRTGADVVEVSIPFPVNSPEKVVEAVLAGLSPHTRIAVIDHVTSPTGLVFPIRDLVGELEDRGVTAIVDGAHAPGMVEVDLAEIGAPFYTGNCHKWMCAPKGAAFLAVRDDWRDRTHPLVTSHGAAGPLGDRSRFHLEFDWTGTRDPSPWLTIPAALETIGNMVPGGWTEVRFRNRRLVLDALAHLCTTLGFEPPCPDEMVGSLVAIPLPQRIALEPVAPNRVGAFQDRLYHEHRIEIPVTQWSSPPRSALRISAHLHNSMEQYRYLAAALADIIH